MNTKGEHSGGNVNYYVIHIATPKRPEFPAYHAECEDIIEALGMTFAEGCAFKALWRSCAQRTLGKTKQGGDVIYDAEKIVYYGNRILVQRKTIASAVDVKPIQVELKALVPEVPAFKALEIIDPAKTELIIVDPVAQQAAHNLLHGKPTSKDTLDYTKVDQELRQAAIDVGRK